jgi:hypothetical protein
MIKIRYLQFKEISMIVEKRIFEINQTLEATTNMIGDNTHKRNEDLVLPTSQNKTTRSLDPLTKFLHF